MRASAESPRMFKSDFLDFFTRTPWWTVPTIWLPVATACVVHGIVGHGLPVLPSLGVAVFFMFLWTLAEYVLHRTVFHWRPDTSWGATFHFFVHGVHHDSPNDRYRLVMPPAAAAILAVIFSSLFRLVLGPDWYLPAFGGFVVGYVIYDCTHYAVHHFKLSSAYLKRMRAHHMNHHFNNTGRRFGVSTALWDRVFRTM